MNYKSRYDLLIETRRARQFAGALEGYTERHHIIPKCMDGSDDFENIVELTPREHFIAHLLLVKIYPKNYRLVYAARRMTHGNKRSNRLCGWLKLRYALIQSLRWRGKNNISFGKKWITNGVESRLLSGSEPMPDGWRYGKTQLSLKSRVWANNGIIERRLKNTESLPEGWTLGRLESKTIGRLWAHNHVICEMISEDEMTRRGWTRGKLHEDLGAEPSPIAVNESSMAMRKRRDGLEAAQITEELWLGIASEYTRLRVYLRREAVVSTIHEFLTESGCKIGFSQVERFTTRPFIGITLQEYRDEYCTMQVKAEKEKRSRRGSRWANNELRDRLVRKDQPLPEGYSLGRLWKPKTEM